ncbi:MAG: hypothetical protein ABI549_12535 [Flavobacterium sp.]|uniref:hypothetical protein n=1 Tax=Flavobacterium sp. TaxID=239 RepID=UPI003266947C
MKSFTTISFFMVLLIAVILFHIGIIVKLIPYEIVWGGQLHNDSEMYTFECISIIINLFLGAVLIAKDSAKSRRLNKILDIILLIFLIVFSLNAIVNAFAKTIFEKSFAIMTLTFVILIWKILNTKNNKF